MNDRHIAKFHEKLSHTFLITIWVEVSGNSKYKSSVTTAEKKKM